MFGTAMPRAGVPAATIPDADEQDGEPRMGKRRRAPPVVSTGRSGAELDRPDDAGSGTKRSTTGRAAQSTTRPARRPTLDPTHRSAAP